jgi:hypothetical protein
MATKNNIAKVRLWYKEASLSGEKYLNLRQISNFCQGIPAWLSKFSNYSLIGIHPTYHLHIAFVLKVQQIYRCFVAKI